MNGMDDNADETNFSDDSLDALPDDALVELEQNAIRSTQQPPRQYPQPDHFAQALNRYDSPAQRVLPQRIQPDYEDFDSEHFDAGLFDDAGVATPVEETDEFIHPRPPGETTQRENWRQERFGQHKHQDTFKQPHRAIQQQHARHVVLRDSGDMDQEHDVEMQDSVQPDEQPQLSARALTSEQEVAFRAQIADLLRERNKLVTELYEANSTVMAQRGEIAIVRSNQSKESKIHQRELAALRKSHQEDAAKYKAEIEAANEESRRIISEKQFIERELEEEEGKTKALQRSLKEREKGAPANAQAITPQKAKVRPLGDGFDDGEIMAISPVKSGRASRNGTPTAGGKRKRKIENASPMAPLVLLSSNPKARNNPQPAPPPVKAPPVIRKDPIAEKNLRFIQRIFNHPVPAGPERIIEKFTQFAFPSETSRPFSTIVLEATAGLSGENIPSDLLQVFVSLWAQALKQKYYKPIPVLVDIVQFIIALDSSVVTLKVITSLLPVLQSSAEINGMIHFHNSPAAHQNLNTSKQKAKAELNEDVDGTACLDILYSIACASLHDEEKIDRFWRLMSMGRGDDVLRAAGLKPSGGSWVDTTSSFSQGDAGNLASGLQVAGASQLVLNDGDLAPGGLSNYTFAQPFTLDLGHGSTLPAAAADSSLSARFTAEPADPVLGAEQLLAALSFVHFEACALASRAAWWCPRRPTGARRGRSSTPCSAGSAPTPPSSAVPSASSSPRCPWGKQPRARGPRLQSGPAGNGIARSAAERIVLDRQRSAPSAPPSAGTRPCSSRWATRSSPPRPGD